jgi:assimilatory nitrate reductase catalytic subunit
VRSLFGVHRDGALTAELHLADDALAGRRVPARLAPDTVASLVCGFCSTGCGLDVHLQGGRAVNVAPAAGYPVNTGHACPKGWAALAPLAAADRLTHPLVRRGGKLVPCDWPEAMRVLADRLGAVQRRHGAEAAAFLSTGQICTEEMALLGAVAKLGLGMVHGDGNTRQCMATAVVAYKETFGFDAPPYTYADLEQSDVIVLWGSNLCVAHPILWQRICQNRHRPEIVVIDPRATETSAASTWHVRPRPKTDLALAYGVAHVLIARGWIDRAYVDAHVSGYDAYAAHVAAFTPARVERDTGVPAEEVERLAARLHAGQRVSQWWTMGVNQSHQGVRTAQAITALALLTGNLGRPGTGANSITGQCNAMGSRLFSNTTNLLGGHDFADPAHRAKVADVLGIDAGRIPTHAGWSYDRILDGALTGAVRALWVIGTNPFHSWINRKALADVRARLDFLVVQDMYGTTETVREADLVLPAAGWGEKDGTFINSERRIGLVQKVARAPGVALPDLAIVQLVARAMGVDAMFDRWRDAESIFGLLRALSAGQPCDFTGVTGYAMLAEHGGVQWPYPADAAAPPAAERRLFEDGRFFTPDGRARLVTAEPAPLPEAPAPRYPLLLLTGRGSASDWHTRTRTGKAPVLARLGAADAYVELNPADARARAIRPDERVKVVSRRAEVIARAVVTERVRPGEVFMPMHDAATNLLTVAAFDPHSRQPAYKASAVQLQRLEGWER